MQVPSSAARVAVRTLSDGPTTRQKILVVSIWFISAIFGLLTCFPDKFSHEKATGEPSSLKSTMKPFLEGQDIVMEEKSIVIPTRATVELSYCSVKNGVNDMLDYIALVVALVVPLIIGPCIVGVFQVIFCVSYAVSYTHLTLPTIYSV